MPAAGPQSVFRQAREKTEVGQTHDDMSVTAECGQHAVATDLDFGRSHDIGVRIDANSPGISDKR